MLRQSESKTVRHWHHHYFHHRSSSEQRSGPCHLNFPIYSAEASLVLPYPWTWQFWQLGEKPFSPLGCLCRERERENFPNDLQCLKWNVPDNRTPWDKVLARLSLTFGTGSDKRNNRLGKNSWLNCSPDSTFSSSRFWHSCAYLWKKKKSVTVWPLKPGPTKRKLTNQKD